MAYLIQFVGRTIRLLAVLGAKEIEHFADFLGRGILLSSPSLLIIRRPLPAAMTGMSFPT